MGAAMMNRALMTHEFKGRIIMNIGGNLGKLAQDLFGKIPDESRNEAADAATSDGGWFTPENNPDAELMTDVGGALKGLSGGLKNLTEKISNNMEELSNAMKNIDPDALSENNMEIQQSFAEQSQLLEGISKLMGAQHENAMEIVGNMRSQDAFNANDVSGDSSTLDAGVAEMTRGTLGKMSEGLNRIFEDLHNVPLETAAKGLVEDVQHVRADLAEKRANGTMTEADNRLSEAINGPEATVLMQSLHKGGIETLDLSDVNVSTPTDRVKGVLEAGARAHAEHHLPDPTAEMEAAHEMIDMQLGERTRMQDNSAEEDASLGL